MSVCLYTSLGYLASKSHFLLCHVTLSPVACHALQYVSTLPQKRQKKYGTQNVCYHFLYNFCLKHFSF